LPALFSKEFELKSAHNTAEPINAPISIFKPKPDFLGNGTG
jgi:hypothetical protein